MFAKADHFAQPLPPPLDSTHTPSTECEAQLTVPLTEIACVGGALDAGLEGGGEDRVVVFDVVVGGGGVVVLVVVGWAVDVVVGGGVEVVVGAGLDVVVVGALQDGMPEAA